MDGGAAEAALGAWASVRGFFTPATLFLVVNLVIGTIALTSRSRRRGNAHDVDDAHHQEPPFHQPQQHQQDNQYFDDHQQQHHEQQQYVPAPLARTSSVMDRLRSIGLYRFRSGDFPPEYVGTDSRDATSAPASAGGDAHHAWSRSEPAREESRRPAPSRMKKSSSVARRAEVPRAPAARAAVLEDDEDDVLHYTREGDDDVRQYTRADEFTENSFTAQQQTPPAARAAVLEDDEDDVLHYTREGDDDVRHYTRADEFTENSFTAQQQTPPVLQHEEEEDEEENYYREEYVPPVRPTPLTRAPSVLERLRSFGLSRFRSGDLAHEQTAAAVDELERNHAQKQQYSRSRSEPSREQSKKGKKQQQESAEARMSKSGSVARNKPAPPVVAAEDVAEGGVDARADDFINTFRKQLQLQRLNSLLNYKEMINRGA